MAEDSARLGYSAENINAFYVAIFNSDFGVSAYGSLVYEINHTMIVVIELRLARNAERFLDIKCIIREGSLKANCRER
jgi:hypothetical protein